MESKASARASTWKARPRATHLRSRAASTHCSRGGRIERRRGDLALGRALDVGGIEIPIPENIEAQVEALKSVDVSALADQAKDLVPAEVKEYIDGVDYDLVKSEVGDGLNQVAGVVGSGLSQVNDSVVQPYWKEQAPKIEAYFRDWWGDYYYDYFIDEWDSGVNDLNRLWNWTSQDWRRGVALVGGTYYGPGIFGFLFNLNKGYKKNLAPIDAIQMMEKTGCLVDVRMDSEKGSGSPDLPRRMSKSYVPVGYAKEWLTPEVMRLSRDTNLLLAKATSSVIADLSIVNKDVILIDSSDNGRAKDIAKVLTKEYGFSAYVVSGGFDAWKRNKLPCK